MHQAADPREWFHRIGRALRNAANKGEHESFLKAWLEADNFLNIVKQGSKPIFLTEYLEDIKSTFFHLNNLESLLKFSVERQVDILGGRLHIALIIGKEFPEFFDCDRALFNEGSVSVRQSDVVFNHSRLALSGLENWRGLPGFIPLDNIIITILSQLKTLSAHSTLREKILSKFSVFVADEFCKVGFKHFLNSGLIAYLRNPCESPYFSFFEACKFRDRCLTFGEAWSLNEEQSKVILNDEARESMIKCLTVARFLNPDSILHNQFLNPDVRSLLVEKFSHEQIERLTLLHCDVFSNPVALRVLEGASPDKIQQFVLLEDEGALIRFKDNPIFQDRDVGKKGLKHSRPVISFGAAAGAGSATPAAPPVDIAALIADAHRKLQELAPSNAYAAAVAESRELIANYTGQIMSVQEQIVAIKCEMREIEKRIATIGLDTEKVKRLARSVMQKLDDEIRSLEQKNSLLLSDYTAQLAAIPKASSLSSAGPSEADQTVFLSSLKAEEQRLAEEIKRMEELRVTGGGT